VEKSVNRQPMPVSSISAPTVSTFFFLKDADPIEAFKGLKTILDLGKMHMERVSGQIESELNELTR
jgi:hypothetical protein